MTRKHYDAFAAHIREDVDKLKKNPNPQSAKVLTATADIICAVCEDDPAFDRKRFLKACGLGESRFGINATIPDSICDALELLRFMQEHKDSGSGTISYSALYENDEQTVGQAIDRILEQAGDEINAMPFVERK